MSLELSKQAAASLLASAKKERDYTQAMYQRAISSAKDYYRNYMRSVKDAAKHKQVVLDWDQIIEDLKGYEPDREMPSSIEELIEAIRFDITKGKDVDLENLVPNE